MTIQATELLQLLTKADKLAVSYNITQQNDGFEIKLYHAWHENDYYHRTVFITNENESTWNKGDYEFFNMIELLDEKLEEQKQKEIKAQKRKELIESLTPEQRELLGV